MVRDPDFAIFSLDADGVIMSWNEHAQRLKGYNAEEIIGRHFSIFYPEDQITSGYPQAELGWATEKGFHVDEGWRVRKDGSRFWARVVIVTQHDAVGAVTGFIKYTRDYTEFLHAHQHTPGHTDQAQD
jgi:PAS domain S-box-containing protein